MLSKSYHASRGILGVNVVVVNSQNMYYLQSAVEGFNIDDFDWGCDNRGSECLARSILHDCMGTSIAKKHYKKFAKDFVAYLPIAGFFLHSTTITEWLKEEQASRVCN